MNDDYELGYKDGYKHGEMDGYARGWHEAMRTNAIHHTSDKICSKCGADTSKEIFTCASVNCPNPELSK